MSSRYRSKALSQQRLQDEPALRASVVAGCHAQAATAIACPSTTSRSREARRHRSRPSRRPRRSGSRSSSRRSSPGKDPRVPIERETNSERPTTVADLLKLYRTRYVEVEPLKSRAGMLSQLNVLGAQLGDPAGDGARTSGRDRGLQGAIRESRHRDDQSLPRSAASRLQLGDRSRSAHARRRSILAASASRRRANAGASGACPKPKNSGCWRRASS